MFCGSCMQDNTMARTLRAVDCDAVLVPTYTPIRVDEENVSGDRIFLGGLNVYLDSTIPGWKKLPRWMTGWLNRPNIIRKLASLSSTDASKLGPLTLDMLKGSAGPQVREYREFAEWIGHELSPDVVIFSNALLSGILPELKKTYSGTILCLLQGDDIFLEGLPAKWKSRVMQQLSENSQLFDGFLTHSQYYEDFMKGYLSVQNRPFARIPLTIDSTGISPSPKPNDDAFCLGYFARICPEKGIDRLLDAAPDILRSHPNARLQIAGFLPKQNAKWFQKRLLQAQKVVGEQIEWLGSPATREDKFNILKGFDALCVPTDYREPKGLYVLEAGLLNLPAIVPEHGAFPELIRSVGAGRLYSSSDANALAEAIRKQMSSGQRTTALRENVIAGHDMQNTGDRILDAIKSLVSNP